MKSGNLRRHALLLVCSLAFAMVAALTHGCYKVELNKEAAHGLAKDPYPEAPDNLSPTLHILAWPDTILPENKADFENRYDVKLGIDTFSNNAEAYELVKANPGKWDIVMVGQYMSNRMRHEGMLSVVPRLNPDVYRYIETAVLDQKADPTMKFFIPYDYSAMGVCFNIDYVTGFPRKWEFLAEHKNNPYIYSRIALPDDMRYAISTMLLFAGLDPTSRDAKDLEVAKHLLLENVRELGLRFVADPAIAGEMKKNSVLLAITWNSEAAGILKERAQCRFLLPEGPNITTVDGFCILRSSPNPQTAALFIEYMLHPYVSLLVANHTMYASVNMRTMKYVDRFLINGPSCMAPPPADQIHMPLLNDEESKRFESVWAEVKKAQSDPSRIKLLPLR